MTPTDRLAALRELILADLRDAYGYDNSSAVADGIMGILRAAGVTLAPTPPDALREAVIQRVLDDRCRCGKVSASEIAASLDPTPPDAPDLARPVDVKDEA